MTPYGREPSFKGPYAAFWRKCWMKKKRAYDVIKRREKRLFTIKEQKEFDSPNKNV